MSYINYTFFEYCYFLPRLREVRKKIKAMQENFHRDVDYHRRRTEDLSSELQLRKVEATSAMEECDRKQSSLKSKDARIVILEAQVRSGGGGGEEGGEG